MKFLLDENAEYRLALYLKKFGHDVTAIARDYPHALTDREVLAIAYRERRILLTNDHSDFGELIFRFHQPHHGVIQFRLGDADVEIKRIRLQQLLTEYTRYLNHYLVVMPERVRIRKIGEQRAA
jgi:predicted nuclease of predicted toxin-antitoxin system